MGEFLTNAQGEDVVAGVRTPMPIAKMAEIFPKVYEQFNWFASSFRSSAVSSTSCVTPFFSFISSMSSGGNHGVYR